MRSSMPPSCQHPPCLLPAMGSHSAVICCATSVLTLDHQAVLTYRSPPGCSGNPKMEPGAVVCRVSPAFIRFGTFQLPSTRPEDLGLARQLADYTIRHHYPHLEGVFSLTLPCNVGF
jgi:Protein adenylyltransferase SelO